MHPVLFFARSFLPVALAAGAFVLPAGAQADTFAEGFDAGVPAAWSQRNNSSPIGPSTWTQGVAALSPAHSGAANSFIVVNFQSGSGVSTLSNWLWTPTLSLTPSSQLTFYTRTASNPAQFPDRLEVRWSSAPTPDVGTSATDVGTFSTLLLSINPALTSTGYPATWTAYTYDFSMLAAPLTGNLAFRYFVNEGGTEGANSSIIGLDTVSITNAIPEPGSVVLMAIGLVGLGLMARRVKRA